MVVSAVLLLGAVTVLVYTVRWAPTCRPLQARSATPDRTTRTFAAYGDAATDPRTWAGGDGTHSVRLPDGRTLWLFADTLLGPVHSPDAAHGGTWSAPEASGVANSVVVQAAPRDGARLTQTLTRSASGSPTSWIPGEHDDGVWSWPVTALIDHDDAHGGRQVLRVLAHRTASGRDAFVFGIGRYTHVRSYSLPDLRLLGDVSLPVPRAAPGHRVLYGTSAIRADRYFYVYGNTAPADGRARLYLARVPIGAVNRPDIWRYWDAGRWRADPAQARSLPASDDDVLTVSTGYSVVRRGDTYVMFAMRSNTRGGGDLVSEITSSWGCSPSGPWHGTYPVYAPPEVANGTGSMIAYNPQLHPAWTDGHGLLLSYDVNDAAGMNGLAHVKNDLSLYRPKFLRVRLGPTTSRTP